MNHLLLKSHHRIPVYLKLFMVVMICFYAGVTTFSDPQPVDFTLIVKRLPVSSEQPLFFSSSILVMRYLMKKMAGIQTGPADCSIPDAVAADIARFERVVTCSLETSIEKALNEISTPVEDIRKAIQILLESQPGLQDSFEQVTELQRCAVRLRNSLQYIVLENGGSDRDAFINAVVDMPQVKFCEASSLNGTDVRSLRDFLLCGVFNAANPLSWLNEILDNEILYAHHQCRTFQLLHAVDNRYRTSSLRERQRIDLFLDKPQWRLWTGESKAGGLLAAVMTRLGVGGCVRDLAIEKRASNILAATRSLRVFLERK